jgi:hypothetical protein
LILTFKSGIDTTPVLDPDGAIFLDRDLVLFLPIAGWVIRNNLQNSDMCMFLGRARTTKSGTRLLQVMVWPQFVR